MTRKRIIGKKGEEYAAHYLISLGYRLIANNFRCRYGEIDLIGLDPRGANLIFAEVKTRSSDWFDAAETTLGPRKYRRLCVTAEIFQKQTLFYADLSPRIDLIYIKLDRCFMLESVQHFKAVGYEYAD